MNLPLLIVVIVLAEFVYAVQSFSFNSKTIFIYLYFCLNPFSVSWGLGASSLAKPRPSSTLLYIYIYVCIVGASYQLVYAAWLVVQCWEILGVQINWVCWPFYRVMLLLSFFRLFPNSTTGVSSFCSLVGYKYLHLTLSAACWAILGICFWPMFACLYPKLNTLPQAFRPCRTEIWRLWKMPLKKLIK